VFSFSFLRAVSATSAVNNAFKYTHRRDAEHAEEGAEDFKLRDHLQTNNFLSLADSSHLFSGNLKPM
jgi:hypothetical protein